MDPPVEVCGKPDATRMDNGPEVTADRFTGWAKEPRMRRLFIQPGEPNQKVFIQRFNRSFRAEVLNGRPSTRSARCMLRRTGGSWIKTSASLSSPWAMCRRSCPTLGVQRGGVCFWTVYFWTVYLTQELAPCRAGRGG
jgi:transposase InsO family protein